MNKAVPLLLLMLPVSQALWAGTPQCDYVESNGVYDVSWADDTAFKYIVERSVNNSPWYWRAAVSDNGRNNYTFRDNGNTPAGSSVRYRLQTKATNNSSPTRDPVICQLRDTERPTQATAIRVTAVSSASLRISWQAASDNVAVDRYLIYRASTDGGSAVRVGETSGLSFTDTGLNASTGYWYYIRAADSSDNIGWRTGYHFGTTLSAPVSATPACQVFEKTDRQFVVSWRDTDVYKYIVERSVNGSPWYWRGAADDNNRDNYRFTDTGSAPAGANIVYRLRTTAIDNNSPSSNPKTCRLTQDQSVSERLTTAKVRGRWEIVDIETGDVVRWNAVSVRTDKFIGNNPRTLGAEDIRALAVVFDTIRMPIRWDQLHTGPGQLDSQLRQQIKRVLDFAEQYDVDVILDPVHLGGRDNFWMPNWVWQQRDLLPANKAKSFNLLNSVEIRQYLNLVMQHPDLGGHPAVVAVEVVNEPHPLGSKDAWRYERQHDLMLAYRSMVNVIRQHRPNLIVVLGAYYGGHLFDNGDDGNAIADVFSTTPNLVWSAHNYFTGIEIPPEGPDYDGDGNPDLDGQRYRGARGAGVWTESYDSHGCYAQAEPYPADVSQCNTSLPLRSAAVRGHANNAANHDRVAQEAGMPFFMGEFGMGRPRNNNTIGWSGTNAFMCDKLRAYKDLHLNGSNTGISWAVWAFDSQVDGGFGLYDSLANRWVPETSNAFFGNCP